MSSDSLESSGELTFSKKRLESRPHLQLDSFASQVPPLYSPDLLSPKSLPAANGYEPDALRSPSQFCSLLSAAISADDAERKSRGDKGRAACCLSLACKSGSILRKDSTPSPSRKCSENLDGNQHPRFMDLPAPHREPLQKHRSKSTQYWDTHSQAGPSRPAATHSDSSPPRRSLTFQGTPDASRSQKKLNERTPIARSQSEAGRALPAFVDQTGLLAGKSEGRRASTSLLPPLQPSVAPDSSETAGESDQPPKKTRTLQFAENPADPIELHERSISRSSRRSNSGSAESSAPLSPLPPDAMPLDVAQQSVASPPASDSEESGDGNESDDETDSDYQAQQESESDDEEDEERGLNWKSRADWIDAGPSMIRKARSLPASPRRQSVLKMKRSPVAISAMLPDAFDDSTASSSPVSSYSATTAATTISSKPRSSGELSTPWSPVKHTRRALSTADARARPSLAATNFQVTMSLSPQMGANSSLVSSPSLTDASLVDVPSSPKIEHAGEDREDALRLLRCCLRAANFFAGEDKEVQGGGQRVISEPATPGLAP